MSARICWTACTIAGCCAWRDAKPAPASTKRSSTRRRTTAPDSNRLARAGQLLDMVVHLYAPLPAASLGYLCRLLRSGVPHLAAEVRQTPGAGHIPLCPRRGRRPLWFWPQGEKPTSARYQGRRQAALPRALRSRGLGPPALPFVLGLGIQASRPMSRPTNAAWAITRCPCYGASTCWAGRI